jgi:hypothetical protein
MPQPIGDLLVEQGVITADQRVHILKEQEETGRPFGQIAEARFGVSAKAVERAWAEQYASVGERVDPTASLVDPAVLSLVNRRQAWQFCVLPMAYDGGCIVVCTTKENLVRALNFTSRHMPGSCYLVVSDPEEMAQALMRHYPMDGMCREMITGRSESGPATKEEAK